MLFRLRKRVISEFPFLKMSDRNFLELIYRELLGREIDPDGIATYTRLLDEGRNRWEIILFLIHSGEFTNRVLLDNLPPEDIKSRKPKNYMMAEDMITKRQILTFEAGQSVDFDWLEQMIRDRGYYERPGIWSFDLDMDKKIMAEIVASFSPQKALEIGCANGAVLKCLFQAGVDVEGVDISALAKARAFSEIRNRIHLGDFLDLALPAYHYDLIFGLDIFEHFNPNRLEALVQKIFENLNSGGYLFCNIPAFGNDPVFGSLFPLYLKAWGKDASESRPFQSLPVDDWGYPLSGHLIWADSFWWSNQMERPGFIREVEIEQALHQKYDAYLEVRAPARKAFFVLSKKADQEKNRKVIDTIHGTSSSALESR
jgi:2-polyprenyl-3-methyl-5-hydroxy-6-metoxy-1,4-benzoquinol methylase